jgi:membrane-associated phospholipid phosphatase
MSVRSAVALSLLLVATPALAQDDHPPLATQALERAAADASAADAGPAAVTAASAQELPGFKALFRDFAVDLRRFPSVQTGLLLGGAGIAAAAVHPHDQAISHTFASSSSLDASLQSGNVLGGPAAQAGFAVATYAVGHALGSANVAALGSDLIRAQMLTQLVTQGIKLATHRTRPDGSAYSFPSGHAATSFATATVLQRHYGWKAGLPAYALATYVGASRVQDSRHYLSDVLFGAALGIAAGRTVTIGHGSARFAMAPMAVDGGGGVGFTWVGPKQ